MWVHRRSDSFASACFSVGLSSGRATDFVRPEAGQDVDVVAGERRARQTGRFERENAHHARVDEMPVTDREPRGSENGGLIPLGAAAKRGSEPASVRQHELEKTEREEAKTTLEGKSGREKGLRDRAVSGGDQGGEKPREHQSGQEETKAEQLLFQLLNAILDKASALEVRKYLGVSFPFFHSVLAVEMCPGPQGTRRFFVEGHCPYSSSFLYRCLYTEENGQLARPRYVFSWMTLAASE